MRSESKQPADELTNDRKKTIVRVAIDRMTRECESDFEFLEQFRTHAVKRFLAWIRSIDKVERTEAALSKMCRQLAFHHIECGTIPHFDQWVRSYGEWPLNSGLDLTWRPRRFAKRITTLVRECLGPLTGSSQSPDFGEDSRFSIPQVRGGLELNTRVADIVLLQFWRGGRSLLDVSYVSLLGLGPTGWKVYSDADCVRAVEQLPGVIAKAKELI